MSEESQSAQVDNSTDRGDTDWVEAFTVKELSRKRRMKLETEHGDIAVFWDDGCPRALANICIHSKRELVKGQIFDGRVVCPGHQWAFDVQSGYCKERDRYQPIHETRIEDGAVHVRITPLS